MNFVFDEDELICCPEVTPSLAELSLGYVSVDDINDIFRELHPPRSSQDSCLLPKLKIFDCVGSYDAVDFPTVVSMLRSRWEIDPSSSVARLESGVLNDDAISIPSHYFVDALRQLKVWLGVGGYGFNV